MEDKWVSRWNNSKSSNLLQISISGMPAVEVSLTPSYSFLANNELLQILAYKIGTLIENIILFNVSAYAQAIIRNKWNATA